MKTINFEKYNISNDKILERTGELFNDRLPEAVGQYGCDLHHFLFNEDYAFIFDDVAEEAKSKMNTSNARLSAFMMAKMKK